MLAILMTLKQYFPVTYTHKEELKVQQSGGKIGGNTKIRKVGSLIKHIL